MVGTVTGVTALRDKENPNDTTSRHGCHGTEGHVEGMMWFRIR